MEKITYEMLRSKMCEIHLYKSTISQYLKIPPLKLTGMIVQLSHDNAKSMNKNIHVEYFDCTH